MNSSSVRAGQIYTLSGQDQDGRFHRRESLRGRDFHSIGYGRSPIINGTTDWTSIDLASMCPSPPARPASFRLQTYDPVPTGNAWFANMSLQQEIPPGLQTFLLYPNYRGLMFSDQSQVASMDLIVTPPAGTSLGAFRSKSTRSTRAATPSPARSSRPRRPSSPARST